MLAERGTGVPCAQQVPRGAVVRPRAIPCLGTAEIGWGAEGLSPQQGTQRRASTPSKGSRAPVTGETGGPGDGKAQVSLGRG